MYCTQCNVITDAASCPKCGNQKLDVSPPQPKDPGVAAVLSVFLPGLGLMYVEQLGLGLCLMVVYLALGFFFVISAQAGDSMAISFGITALIIWLFGLFGAYYTAKSIRRKLATIINTINATSSNPE